MGEINIIKTSKYCNDTKAQVYLNKLISESSVVAGELIPKSTMF